MPKRQCPFDCDLLPQMKIRLGQKEYDIQNGIAMSKIYDKTIQKLFNGTKQLYESNDNAIKTKILSMGTTEIEQKCAVKNISEYCTLCTDLNLAENKCSFCDKWTCQICSAICCKCNDIFCTTHYLKYQNDTDSVCLNCS